LPLAASTSAAWAQSSVTLYGILDAAVRYTTNNNGAQAAGPGGMSRAVLASMSPRTWAAASRPCEHGAPSEFGQRYVAATDFWRQAWVGVQSNEFGQIRLGRQYNVLFDLYTSTYASFRYSPYIEVQARDRPVRRRRQQHGQVPGSGRQHLWRNPGVGG
jgi:predicted porin